ncbi:Hsp70 family protein [Dictyobacter arantiisoli]|uniref:Molecular chaperone DnaK n=1 Tax=Dictyobacter arantiisoli TaxID=2014874 RepID=A0A5A5TCE7_9CHLR|nr:Hsp70 family protein [Dictyobacter arantiisoli]GCF08703.1 molecular chaperone DnaK [Dictyobacter arantiisoli]
MSTVVGIDLGTTYSVIAYVNAEGKPEIIPNQDGKSTTPSVIQFTPQGPLVGASAKEAQANGDKDTIAFFKRSMGDSEFLVSFYDKDYTPTELSTLVLRQLKEQAEVHLHQPVTDAVITVPAYFTHLQRTATIEAGTQAGLNVLKIISEPTAAALAYGLRPHARAQRVLVYDLGGGTFDVSLVEITDTELNVQATDGDHKLGGKDWDDSLIQYLAIQFEHEFGIELNDEELNDLSVQAERLKHTLSLRQSAPIRIHGGGHVGNYTVTRSHFEEITRDLMEKTKLLTERVLAAKQLTWADIDGVLPVGGSTRMPVVRTFIEQMSGKAPMSGINPDEAVALGAAIQAVMELEQRQKNAPHFHLAGRKKTTDVIAHSLGMVAESPDNERYINSFLIQKNLTIPTERTKTFKMRLLPDGTTKMEVYLTQSESDDPQECTYLGLYTFSGFPHLTISETEVDVTYTYDKNGVVNIAATEKSTGCPLLLKIEDLPADVPERFLLAPARQAPQQPSTVYLAFDLSGSMRGKPLRAAQKAARDFVLNSDLQYTSIGLISFSNEIYIDLKATKDPHKIEQAIDGLLIGRTGPGNLGHPFKHLSDLLRHERGLHYALVLTDGAWVYPEKAIKAAKKCHSEQIEVIAVGFGNARHHFLSQIASSAKQSLFTDLGNLSSTFSTIAQEIAVAAPR